MIFRRHLPPFEPTAWIAAWLATAGMRLRR